MCGRYFLQTLPEQLAAYFDIKGHKYPIYAPSYNIAPTQFAPVVRLNDQGERTLDLLRWGLIPAWAKDSRIASQTINARAETVAEKPSFRQAFKHRRCLVPMSGYFEWVGEGRDRSPYAIRPNHGDLLVAAGIFEHWRSPEQEVWSTFSVLTCAANDDIAVLHDRMPVLLDQKDWDFWLGAPVQALSPLLQAAPNGSTRYHKVDRAVGNPRNNALDLLTPPVEP